MKKNVLFIVVDSVTNDVLFNKENSKNIAPFLNELRKKCISGDKMYSEAPYTEAALMSLLGSVDTMDCGGYMEKLKNTHCVLEEFQKNGYKVFFNNYYPSIYPSYSVKGYDEKKYMSGFDFNELWEYRFKYFAPLYLSGETSKKEEQMLFDILEDNLKSAIEYLNKIKNKDEETTMINDCVNINNIDNSISAFKEEYNKFLKNKSEYLKVLFSEKQQHILFKIDNHPMIDKIQDDNARTTIIKKYKPIFKKIKWYNFKYNILNNKIPFKGIMDGIKNKKFNKVKGLIAGYKNSLFDKDLYERINTKYDLFKNQRSFYTISQELFSWIDANKEESWMCYIHVDDAHYNESFFTYDTSDLKVVESDFKDVSDYLKNLPSSYCGSITSDLSLRYCDKVIKNIFEYLDKNKLLENTAVVITADHGFSYYFCPAREKYVISSYKENYNVPFLIYDKDIKPKKIDGFCQTKDIPSTLLELANIKIPKQFKGKNLKKYNGQDYAILEYMGGGCPDILRRPVNLGVWTDNYFVSMNIYLNKNFDDQKITEVYNLVKDPKEYINLNTKKNIKQHITYELKILKKRYNELCKEYGVKNDKN